MVTRLFTNDQEVEISLRYAEGESGQSIADDLGASRQCISNIIKRNGVVLRPAGGAPVDRTDKRYGRLVVERISDKRTQSGVAYWWCRCDCGNTREVAGDMLSNRERKKDKTTECTECGLKTKISAGIKNNDKMKANREKENLKAREKLRNQVPDEWFNLPLTAEEAKKKGLSHYFSGQKCVKGHISKRYLNVSTGLGGSCMECKKEDSSYKRESPIFVMQERARERERSKDPEVKKQKASYVRDRRRNDPIFRMRCNLSTGLSKALKKKGSTKDTTTMKLVGSDLQTLVNHLESFFEKDMTWENYGQWHVDHIRPITSFDQTNHEHQQVCWNWRNLFPLWGDENKLKGDEYEPIDETEWVTYMQEMGFEGELFLKYEEGNSY